MTFCNNSNVSKFFLVILLNHALGQYQASQRCFQLWPNQRLQCVFPFERRNSIGESQCLDLCKASIPRCHSLVYNSFTKRCDLFDVFSNPPSLYGEQSGTGTMCNEAVLAGNNVNTYPRNRLRNKARRRRVRSRAAKRSLVRKRTKRQFFPYRRALIHQYPPPYQPQYPSAQPQPTYPSAQPQPTYPVAPQPTYPQTVSALANCGTSTPRIVQCPGYNYYRPVCSQSTSSGYAVPSNSHAYPAPAPAYPATQAPAYPATVAATYPSVNTYAPYTTQPPYRVTATPAPYVTSGPATSDGTTCTGGQVARYTQIDSAELAGNDDLSFASAGPTECTQSCTNNRVPCRSAEFNFATSICTLSAEALVPRGRGQLRENSNSMYFEKICVDGTAAQNCPGPFFHSPQMILVGWANTVTDASSLADCLNQCLNAVSLFGFNCRSGMIFYEESQLNCVLNFETAETEPEFFSATDEDAVDYFEPKCTRRLLAVTDTDPNNNVLPLVKGWGPWTPCDRKLKRKFRFRKCKTSNPNSCRRQMRKCNE